jgi:hypothetical protein
MTQSNTAMAHSNNAMTQSNNVESKKPQHPQQQALLEQLRNVSGGWNGGHPIPIHF